MKIYTRTGDAGETGLYGGQRVGKDHIRVEAYGTVDEVNAVLGAAGPYLKDDELREWVVEIQRELFTVGADLATPLDASASTAPRSVPRIVADQVFALEAIIDRFEAELPPLQQFILPGGDAAAAHLHHARTVARRAERRIVALLHAEPEGVNPEVLRYLNRLADLLFVLARIANHRAGVADVPWTRPE